MRIMSIDSPETIAPASKGKLTICNVKNNVTTTFITKPQHDGAIAASIKGAIPLALGKNFNGANMVAESGIKNLMDSIAIATGDKFVQSLPKVEKEAYAIFNIEPNVKSFLNIKDKFVIYHNM